jgi:type IV pilus assembly protein PilM
VWGIDLGQCALKALRLQDIDGKLVATAFDYIEYPKILNQPDADADQLTREAMEQFLSRNTLRGDIVAISVPGQSGLARFVKLPPVEEKKIHDIVKFEAKQQIPFNLDEVVWDYQKLGAGEVVDGFALETEVGLFAMKRDIINRFLQHFKDVGVEVHVIQMAPLALCNFLAYEMLGKEAATPPSGGKEPCVVGLDIGTDSSTLVITDGGRIIWQRAVALGGNHFTRALTKDLKLTFAKAEHLKRNATKSGAAELKKILGSLKPVLTDFVGEVQRSLGYFTNTHRDAQIDYMVGLGNAFRLPGLQRFLSEKLQLEVRKIDKLAKLGGEEILNTPICHDNILSFGVAYGLCLQGMKRGRLVTNLLPGELRLERLIRSKKPWAVAAAGVMLLGLGGAVLGGYLDERPYKAESVKEAKTKATSAVAAAKAQDDAFAKAKKDAQDEEEAVKSIVAGQAERLNWMNLTKFISEALPQPDGKNLPPDRKTLYWDTRPNIKNAVNMSGKEAFEEYQTRLREGLKPPAEDVKDVDPLPRGIDNLVQISIESVDARFCDDLPTFWKAATKGLEEARVRPLEHYKKVLPKDKDGWVVEVTGYTYHQAKENFITDTLLKNFERFGIVADAKPAPTPGEVAPPKGDDKTPTVAADKDNKMPVVNRISHILLFKTFDKKSAEPGNFEIINTSELDTLIAASSAASGTGGPPGPGGMSTPPGMGGPGGKGGLGGGGDTAAPAAPNRSTWVPASSRAGAAGGAPGGAPGGAGRFGMGSRGGPAGGPAAGPAGGPAPAGGAAGAATGTNTFGHVRTEFVILFIWKEATPSDALRAGAEPEKPADAAK